MGVAVQGTVVLGREEFFRKVWIKRRSGSTVPANPSEPESRMQCTDHLFVIPF